MNATANLVCDDLGCAYTLALLFVLKHQLADMQAYVLIMGAALATMATAMAIGRLLRWRAQERRIAALDAQLAAIADGLAALLDHAIDDGGPDDDGEPEEFPRPVILLNAYRNAG